MLFFLFCYCKALLLVLAACTYENVSINAKKKFEVVLLEVEAHTAAHAISSVPCAIRMQIEYGIAKPWNHYTIYNVLCVCMPLTQMIIKL